MPSYATPFSVPASISLLSHQLAPDSIRAALTDKKREGREALARSWLTEGIPFAFAGCPGVFDQLRVWIGRRLDVDAKSVTLVGSARVGFSLAPPPKYGTEFGVHSDLDMAVVSGALFRSATRDFERFRVDFEGGVVTPKPTESKFWHENVERVPGHIRAGFMDTKYVPNRLRYACVSGVAQTMWLLTERLKVTEGAPTPSKATLRVYKDWQAAIDRISFNLSTALKNRAA